MEIFRAVPEGAKEIPVMRAPGIVEGRIDRPGEAQVIHLKIDKPADIAIEVETPKATLPTSIPVVRLIDPDGREIATDVYTKLNNNGLYMMKMIEAKTTVSLTRPASTQYRSTRSPPMARDPISSTVCSSGRRFRTSENLRWPRITSIWKRLQPPRDGNDRPRRRIHGYVTVDVEGLPDGVTALPAH